VSARLSVHLILNIPEYPAQGFLPKVLSNALNNGTKGLIE